MTLLEIDLVGNGGGDGDASVLVCAVDGNDLDGNGGGDGDAVDVDDLDGNGGGDGDAIDVDDLDGNGGGDGDVSVVVCAVDVDGLASSSVDKRFTSCFP